MSWAETMKINNDMSEPLNYTNYIYDISVFGNESYAMDINNHTVWDDLCLNSCYLYGHTAIHDYVYDRLTEENIDNLFLKSGKLGRQLNNFHTVNTYAVGDINAVLGGMTLKSYNNLLPKLRQGYQRYVNEKLSMTSGVAAWINDVFGLSISEQLSTVSEIVNDNAAWTMLLESEAAMMAITSSEYVMSMIVDSSVAVEKITDAIVYASDNEVTINAIIENETVMEIVVESETAMTNIAASQAAMTVICFSTVAFAKMISSTTAMTIVANSQTAIDVIIEAITYATNAETVLGDIKINITTIKDKLPSIVNSENAVQEATETIEKIDTTMLSFGKVTSKADTLILNISTIINNEVAMNAILNDDVSATAIINNDASMNAIINNVAIRAIINKSIATTQAISNNRSRLLKVYNSWGYNNFYNNIVSAGSTWLTAFNNSPIKTSATVYHGQSSGSGNTRGVYIYGKNRTQTLQVGEIKLDVAKGFCLSFSSGQEGSGYLYFADGSTQLIKYNQSMDINKFFEKNDSTQIAYMSNYYSGSMTVDIRLTLIYIPID